MNPNAYDDWKTTPPDYYDEEPEGDFIEPDEPEDWTEDEYADAADYYYGMR